MYILWLILLETVILHIFVEFYFGRHPVFNKFSLTASANRLGDFWKLLATKVAQISSNNFGAIVKNGS